MRSSLRHTISDVFFIFRYRMLLIMKDPVTMLALCISAVLFAVMVRSLAASSEDYSALPIGIVDYDNSECSRQLIAGLKKSETLRVIEGTEGELYKHLMDEMITSYFIIEKGYEENLKDVNLKNLISMYYKEDNKSASIIADIVAGEIIYPASLYKAFRYYDNLQYSGKKLTMAEYEEYMRQFIESSKDFNFAFQLIYQNPLESQHSDSNLSNSVLYNQLIIGILGIMVAFIAMFMNAQTVTEKENGVDIRLQSTGFHCLKKDVGNLCAIMLWEGVLSLIFSLLVVRHAGLSDRRLWLNIWLLILLNSMVLGTAMLLMTKLIHRMLPYQLICSSFILLTGGLGFYQLLTGFYQSSLNGLVKIIPNSWFIQGFTDIIVYGDKDGYLKEGHRILLIMAITAIFLMIAADVYQGLRIKNIRNKTARH